MAAPKSQTFNDLLPADSVAMDPNAFDALARNHGVKMEHWRAMKCPVGMVDPDDIHRGHHHHHCQNGFIYRKAGTITVLFTGNSTDPRIIDVGLIDGSSAQLTFPRFYDDDPTKQVYVSYADRLFFSQDVGFVPDWHTLKTSATGTDRLQFPAAQVHHVIDSNGREYDPSLYTIQQGNLVWNSNDRPEPGQVLTVWYVYKPFYYIARVLHEVRVTQIVDPLTGEARMERMLYSAIIQRENVFRNEENDPETKDQARKQTAPESGGFGPR